MAKQQANERKESKQQSKVEVAKRNSHRLRGTIAETLASDASHFGAEDVQVLKFHGVYQQDDRDSRTARKQAGEGPDYFFMVRVALPGGRMTADQYLTLDRLAEEHGNGTLRITTRQGMQFHGVYKEHLRPILASVNEQLMTTLAACGDVERNVMCDPAPIADEVHLLVQDLARQIAKALRPATRAYHEIWVGGAKVYSGQESEPFYGEQYLPRKFKTGITLADESSLDVYSYDCGLIAIVKDGQVQGFNLIAGGGMGMNHNRSDTMAALAQPVGFIGVKNAVEAVRTVAAIFRDHGNRADRKHARLKYLIAEWGMERFREEFRNRASFEVRPWKPVPRPSYRDYLGSHPQQNGKHFFGVFVQNGRIADHEQRRLKTALRDLVSQYRPGVTLTPNQNLLLTDLEDTVADGLDSLLRSQGVMPLSELSLARRYSMACPALPTCGLALTESERVMPKVVDDFERELERLGLDDEPITLRMTGCPNGCARPYTADIAFVGRKPGEQYNVYVGGGLAGDRVADLYAEDVPADELVSVLRPLLEAFARRRNGEAFSDFYQRLIGNPTRRDRITGKEEATRTRVEGALSL